MRRYVLVLVVLLCASMMQGCGQLGEENGAPTGVTGGQESGYGVESPPGGTGTGPVPPNGNCSSSVLVGSWTYSQYGMSVTLTFSSSCVFSVESCETGAGCETTTGTYADDGDGNLETTVGGLTETMTYSYYGTSLTIYSDGYPMTFTRN